MRYMYAKLSQLEVFNLMSDQAQCVMAKTCRWCLGCCVSSYCYETSISVRVKRFMSKLKTQVLHYILYIRFPSMHEFSLCCLHPGLLVMMTCVHDENEV